MRNDGHSRSRQKRWLVHILRHDSLLRITLRRNTRGKGCGRPRTMFLDWLLKTEEDNISYDELKNVGTRQIKMVSVKMETCHGQNTIVSSKQWQCQVSACCK